MTTPSVPAVKGQSTPAPKTVHPVIQAIMDAEKDFIKAYGSERPDVRQAWIREAEWARQAIVSGQSSSYLQQCSPVSIKGAIINVALTGTTLNPVLREADIIPRKVRGQYVACLDHRYGGLIKIAVDAGAALSIKAFVVYDWDEFDYDEGRPKPVIYKPAMAPKDQDGVMIDPMKLAKDPKMVFEHLVCVASKAVLPSGAIDWIVLRKWELMKVRETSMSKDSEFSPWVKWPEAQLRKTGIKYHSKTLKGKNQDNRLALAVQLQNDIDGLDLEKQKGRDIGSELDKRMGFAALTDTTGAAAPTEEPAAAEPTGSTNATSEGLTGSRLALWERVAEMAAGDVLEMGKVLANLSAGKIKCREDLLTTEDLIVTEIINKITGGKK